MKKTYKICLLLSVPIFTGSCTDQENLHTNNEDVKICAGIDSNPSCIISRVGETYSNFIQGTQICLYTSGTWTGHTPATITKASTATAASAISNKNTLTFTSNPIYWDDYGTADPANVSTGRNDGLSIYGAAVNGITTDNTKLSSSTILSWDLGNDQSTGFSNNDLLISNNIKNESTDNRYKFINRSTPANLIFKHAMSKVTINLYKGKGFSDSEVTTGLNANITLLNMSTSGKINVADGSISNLSTPNANGIKTFLSNKKNGTIGDGGLYATYAALVFPTNIFQDNINVLKIEVNGNTYLVKGDSIINKAETSNTATSHSLISGNNYVFNVIVSKTQVALTTQIMDWNTISSNNIEPVIIEASNRTDGATGSQLKTNFKLWYSDNLITNYTTNTELSSPSPVIVTYNSITGKFDYTQLYWPSHTKGYHFRGAMITDKNDITLKDEVSNDMYPVVVKDNTNGDYIELSSGKEDYHNLSIGTHYNSITGNNNSGALATSGNVILTFYHKMAYITVILKTSDLTSSNRVNLGTNDTDMAKLYLLNYKTGGKVLIGTGSVSATGTATSFLVPTVTTTYSSDTSNDYYKRASYVIPQDISGMAFQAVINSGDGFTDTYTSKTLNLISVQEGSSGLKTITEWKPGYKYTYTLTITKTDIKISALITDWTIVTGSTDVPFLQ